jgi:hypothetical protein
MRPSRAILTGSVATSLIVAGSLTAEAQVQTAGNLLINLDATSLTTGTISEWTNAGTLGGSFFAGSAGSASIQRQTVDGVPSVVFDGRSEWMTGPLTTGTGVEGLNPNRTIEMWLYNGNVQGEESVIAWGHRGVDNGNFIAGYGRHSAWGAVAQWGAADIGFDPGMNIADPARSAWTQNYPTRGEWHHIAYTFDGRADTTVSTPTHTSRLYVNGIEVNSEVIGPDVVNTILSQPFVIGAQNNSSGNGVEDNNDLAFSGAVSRLRVHDGVLSAAQVTQNYNAERSAFNRTSGDYTQPTAQIAALPIHRYKFDLPNGLADGAIIPDEFGTADAQVKGFGATFEDGKLKLPGGSSSNAAYVDLPNGILSGIPTGSVTLEAWVTINDRRNWARIWDFGTGTAGEITDVGGSANGVEYVLLAPNQGTGNDGAFERAQGSESNGGTSRSAPESLRLGVELHQVVTYDSDSSLWNWYEDGILMGQFTDFAGISTLSDVNNWLGRSNWTGDDNLFGDFNEFRIYDYALSQAEIAGNFAAGPDLVNIPEPSAAAALLIGTLALGATRPRRRA